VLLVRLRLDIDASKINNYAILHHPSVSHDAPDSQGPLTALP
jgi:hypothetical protein